MARLSTKARKELPKGKFALPGGTKAHPGKPAFPIENRDHAEKAMQLAPRSLAAGNITKAQETTVERRARAAEKRMAPAGRDRGRR